MLVNPERLTLFNYVTQQDMYLSLWFQKNGLAKMKL
jgi:hypothetical protein